MIARLLVGIALGQLLAGPAGCMPKVDPLIPAADTLNAAAAAISAKARAHNAATQAAHDEAKARCAPLAEAPRLACETTAARDILDATAQERAQLDVLEELHDTARRALTLADTCRRDGASCEAQATADAVLALERLEAALRAAP